jgi:hypothetical protein
MPVSSTSAVVNWSTNGGGSAWVGEFDTFDGATLINGFADDVHESFQSGDTNWDHGTSVDDLMTTNEALDNIHGDGMDVVFTQMGGDFEDKRRYRSLGQRALRMGGRAGRATKEVSTGE